MNATLFRQAHVVNEGAVKVQDVLISGDRIVALGVDLAQSASDPKVQALAAQAQVHDCTGKWLMPGCIHDQVHFREPGLTHKAEIATESAAAAAGGITSFMEMPNTVPQALTQELLQDKYDRAAEVSPVNYSFFMGASNHNLDEVLKTDPARVCGIKVFMGSSTGDMLVDESKVLEGIFKEAPTLVATHCEDEATVRANSAAAKERHGERVPIDQHPLIRSAEACYRSSSKAVELATKLNTQLHILHISTARELDLFDGTKELEDKRITAEACIHHLWFSDADYADKGTHIKWNPAVKTAHDREQIRAAILDGRIDVVATDHAPHTKEEKNNRGIQATHRKEKARGKPTLKDAAEEFAPSLTLLVRTALTTMADNGIEHRERQRTIIEHLTGLGFSGKIIRQEIKTNWNKHLASIGSSEKPTTLNQ